MIRKKIRVLIIEDSKLYQCFLRQVIEADDCLTVAGIADSGKLALEKIPEILPDIITLDLQLPDVPGFVLLKEILDKWDIPVIVVSGETDSCKEAVSLGARDFILKMQDAEPQTAAEFRFLLKLKLKMQAEVKRGPDTENAISETGIAAGRKQEGIPEIIKEKVPGRTSKKVQEKFSETAGSFCTTEVPPQKTFADGPEKHLIAIGASLGGTEITLRILQRLPDWLPGIVIVQHMPPEYTAAYAERLNRSCSLSVREAETGNQVLPGTALVARGGLQLRIRSKPGGGYLAETGNSKKHGGFCPSVDVLFRSVAEAAGASALGVILTGMGKDGAEGMKQMHDNRAYTLGQSRESCAVFGMPGAAWGLGGVDRLLPPDLIADEIIRYYSRYKKSEV